MPPTYPSLRALLTDPPPPSHPWLRRGFLVFCLGLLLWHQIWRVDHPWIRLRREPDILGLVFVALLLNHLAFRFTWSRAVTAGLRLLACGWLIFGVGYWLKAMYS
jgi:hypothetical protein